MFIEHIHAIILYEIYNDQNLQNWLNQYDLKWATDTKSREVFTEVCAGQLAVFQ